MYTIMISINNLKSTYIISIIIIINKHLYFMLFYYIIWEIVILYFLNNPNLFIVMYLVKYVL